MTGASQISGALLILCVFMPSYFQAKEHLPRLSLFRSIRRIVTEMVNIMRRFEAKMTDKTSAVEYSPSRWLNKTVLGAGLTSALGDFCYETTIVILPGFLAVLGIPAAALGIIEGIADAVASFTKMASGFIADKLGHRKALVLIGYALTPLGQVLIALAVGLPLLLLGRIVSWFGKGLRGPLRDAIVVQAVSPQARGRAFGFHRAMDTLRAVAGPLLGGYVLGVLTAVLTVIAFLFSSDSLLFLGAIFFIAGL